MATATSVMAVIRASRPSFRKPHDNVAFAVHASFLCAGYTLVAAGNSAFSYSAAPSSPEQGEVGIEGWNDLEDCYGFVYTKEENGTKISVLVKCLVMGDDLLIDALPLTEDLKEPYHLRIKVNDFVYKKHSEASNYDQMFQSFPALVAKLKSDLIDKLENNPKKESTSSSRSEATQMVEGSDHSSNQHGVGIITENRPYSLGYDYPPVPPIGIDDLVPGPAAGVYPSRGGFGSGGGMLLGPNDPRWGGMGGQPGGIGGQPGFRGGRLPPGVPPGARFDPFGPPGVPGFEPGRFIRDPHRPGGGTHHPDLEHFGGSDYI